METVSQAAAGLQGEDKSNTFKNSVAYYFEQSLLFYKEQIWHILKDKSFNGIILLRYFYLKTIL